MSEHTKEPWRTKTGSAWEFADSEGGDIGFCDCGTKNSRDEANARRIVACVNYCAGLSLEYLELNPPRDPRGDEP